VPDVLDEIRALSQRAHADETFPALDYAVGKKEVRVMLAPHPQGDAADVSIRPSTRLAIRARNSARRHCVGECAGEVVSLFRWKCPKLESTHFEGILALDEGNFVKATRSLSSILGGACDRRHRFLDVNDDPNKVVAEFQARSSILNCFRTIVRGQVRRRSSPCDHENTPGEPSICRLGAPILEEAKVFLDATYSCESPVSTAAIIGAWMIPLRTQVKFFLTNAEGVDLAAFRARFSARIQQSRSSAVGLT